MKRGSSYSLGKCEAKPQWDILPEWENCWALSTKAEYVHTQWCSSYILRYEPDRTKGHVCIRMLLGGLFVIAKLWKQLKCYQQKKKKDIFIEWNTK